MLNEDRGYVSRWEDFHWIPGARETVAAFNRAGWLVIVVTNQSGVGRGFYSEQDVRALHARMSQDLNEVRGHIDAFYYAPHHPDAPVDTYRHPDPPDRKPNPGMILRAFAEWPIDKAASLLVGALSVWGAIFLILELDQPYAGVLRLSDSPLRTALTQIDR